jgi:predicted TIM-barrel fold metal-dependent hydrolase
MVKMSKRSRLSAVVKASVVSIVGIFVALFAHLLLAGNLRPEMLPSGAPAQELTHETQPVAALSPFIDVHVHITPDDPARAVEAAVQGMKRENVSKIILMPSPFIMQDAGKFDADLFLTAVKKYPGKLAFLGGGGTLNAMIQQAASSDDAGPDVQRTFREQAEKLLQDGAVGFGELTAEHLPSATSPSHQAAPPDNPLFLVLADIAAQHDVPIDLHMEAIPQTMPLPAGLKSPPNPPQLQGNIAAFERLLSHNPRAKIVWDHVGSTDNTGYRTPELCGRLLQAHSNLYMQIKVDPLNPGKNPLLVDGKLKPEWLKLFQDFPDRFFIGSDQSYPEQATTGLQRWQAVVLLFNQLPANLRRKIGEENALHVYFGKH